MLAWLCLSHSAALEQGMFVRKPNPTLTLIHGQRNSCNLSLYLLGSLFPFSLSHTLGVSSVGSCLSHQLSVCSVSETMGIMETESWPTMI